MKFQKIAFFLAFIALSASTALGSDRLALLRKFKELSIEDRNVAITKAIESNNRKKKLATVLKKNKTARHQIIQKKRAKTKQTAAPSTNTTQTIAIPVKCWPKQRILTPSEIEYSRSKRDWIFFKNNTLQTCWVHPDRDPQIFDYFFYRILPEMEKGFQKYCMDMIDDTMVDKFTNDTPSSDELDCFLQQDTKFHSIMWSWRKAIKALIKLKKDSAHIKLDPSVKAIEQKLKPILRELATANRREHEIKREWAHDYYLSIPIVSHYMNYDIIHHTKGPAYFYPGADQIQEWIKYRLISAEDYQVLQSCANYIQKKHHNFDSFLWRQTNGEVAYHADPKLVIEYFEKIFSTYITEQRDRIISTESYFHEEAVKEQLLQYKKYGTAAMAFLFCSYIATLSAGYTTQDFCECLMVPVGLAAIYLVHKMRMLAFSRKLHKSSKYN